LDGIKACTKVAWDFAIQPHALGGIKLLEPVIQASSLLAKLFIHGLRLGFEPWKIFFLQRYGTWPSSTPWLSIVIKIHNQRFHMFMGIWVVWYTIIAGLIHVLPTTWAETLRQPFFRNTHLRNPMGDILGTHNTTKFGLRAARGFTLVANIWNIEF
jgi:hypothetical protein